MALVLGRLGVAVREGEDEFTALGLAAHGAL